MAKASDQEWKASMRIGVDFNRSRAERVGAGKGLSAAQLEALAPRVATVMRDLIALRTRGEVGFMDLPYHRGPLEASQRAASRLRERFDTLVVFGIGGSSLGGQTLVEALAPPYQELLSSDGRGGPRVLFCDNVDPDRLGALLELVDLRQTAFCVITKSGSTTETMAQFWILRDRLVSALGSEGYRERVVGITDPQSGRLRELGGQDRLELLDIPPRVGGRYSVLTPVGLLPAAVAGVDIRELLAGAAEMDQRCRAIDLWQNPAAALAACCYLMDTQLGRPILVVWPYADGLRRFAGWFVQLWAESLGKKVDLEGKLVSSGATPLAAVGVCDQHAQNQLFMEGPENKFIVFVQLQHFERRLALPLLEEHQDQEDVAYLSGKQLADLMEAEYLATATALADAGRPSCTVSLPVLNPFTLGGLVYLMELACTIAGGLYRVNPFNQPGVEAGKQLTYALMGRRGFEMLAARVAAEKAGEEKFRF